MEELPCQVGGFVVKYPKTKNCQEWMDMAQTNMPDAWEQRRNQRAARAKAAARRKKRDRLILLVSAAVLVLILVLALVRCGDEKAPGGETGQASDTTEPTGIVETGRATVTVTGDLLIHKPIITACAEGSGYDFTEVFQYIADYVSQADLAVANLETTLAGTDNGYEYSGYPNFNCPDAIVDAARAAGFDMLLTANNHSYDTDSVGFLRTQQVIRDKGLQNLGTTMSDEETPYIIKDVGGIRLGLICYTYGEIDVITGQPAVNAFTLSQELANNINVFAYDKLDRFYGEMEQRIGAMRADGAEAIVLFIHWGAEYQTHTTSSQPVIAQKMCDLGVDVIVGGHPHVVQPVEVLTSNADPSRKTLCVYSLGNAMSNQRADNMDLKTGHTEDGMLFTFTFVKYSNGLVTLDSARLLPTWVCIRSSDTVFDYNILPLDKTVADWKSAFDIGDGNLAEAEDSWQRTMELTGEGMETVDAWLESEREARQAAFAADN